MAFWNKRVEPAPTLAQGALAAAAKALVLSREEIVNPKNDQWQEEAWGYHERLGEFRYATDWRAEMISRVRLRAGRIIPGHDEPQLLDHGPAAEIVAELAGGIGGQSQIMAKLATLLDVPGESYLVGETKEGKNVWWVASSDEIRRRGDDYEVIDAEKSFKGRMEWRELDTESYVTRIWRPHRRHSHEADSPAHAAMDVMRELELVNRRIQARYMSRLAMCGFLFFPDEISFPAKPEFAEAEDPFYEELIEVARKGIAEHGTVSSIIPIPLRIPSEYIEKIRFVDPISSDDEDLIAKRESAIRRLAMQVDVPAEILLGMSDVNHWSAWKVSEDAVTTHLSPTVELIAHSLTIAYLHPRLKAMQEYEPELVMWYDLSEIVHRPDKSEQAVKAYDRLELNGVEFRKAMGFDESGKPNKEDLRELALRKLAINPQTGMVALAELVDDPELALYDALQRGGQGIVQPRVPIVDPRTPRLPDRPDEPAPITDNRQPPDTLDQGPSNDINKVVQQATAQHRLRFTMNDLTLWHPDLCKEHMFSCPVTEASRFMTHYPGTSGDYECWLSPQGDLTIGQRVFDTEDNFRVGHTRRKEVRQYGNNSKARS